MEAEALLSEFHVKELEFSAIVTGFTEDDHFFAEARVNRFAKAMSEYSRHLNRCLDTYAKIDYNTQKEKKIEGKAYLKFAYDFLALLTSILRKIEADPVMSNALAADFSLIDNLIDHKEKLIQTDYSSAARQELIAFYDPKVRERLEEDLLKRVKR